MEELSKEDKEFCNKLIAYNNYDSLFKFGVSIGRIQAFKDVLENNKRN